MIKSEYILGISSHFHDSAAALLRGQSIIAAAQEERFTRKKADWSFPDRAIDYCLSQMPDPDAQVTLAYFENPALKFDRILETASRVAPRGAPLWPRTMKTMRQYGHELPAKLRAICADPERVFFVPHHRSHAAAAFYPSPFEQAAVLVVDGVGEWSTVTMWKGEAQKLTPLREIKFPNSLGMFYSAFTQYCGFKVNSGEYKLMGLAPFGVPRYQKLIREKLIDLNTDGSFALDMNYFNYDRGLSTISPLFEMLFGRVPRSPEGPLDQHYMDVAASAQAVLQEAMVRLASTALQLSGEKNLCLAGGVALNCVSNSHLASNVPGLEELWIQPASGDAGGALGAALDVAAHQPNIRVSPGATTAATDGMQGSFLGPEFDREFILSELIRSNLVWEEHDDLPEHCAAALADGQIVGHFDGRMEFGPRALGNRSILADPRPADMRGHINRRIKFREGWRPFAPMVLEEHAAEIFNGPSNSPYMLFVAKLKAKYRHEATLRSARERGLSGPMALMRAVSSDFSGATHVDFSARLQTVGKSSTTNGAAKILRAFHSLTQCPMLLNTSFNVRGEPIVCTPWDAIQCFKNTHMDMLVIGPFIVRRTSQDDRINKLVGRKKFVAD